MKLIFEKSVPGRTGVDMGAADEGVLKKLGDVLKYTGKYADEVRKNVFMTNKMRSYALNSTSNEENIIPYYIALLEWVLPIVCYWGAPLQHKKISMIVAGVISGKLMKVKSLSGV